MKEISFRTDVLPLKNELFRMALRITLNRDDAEDVVQETMMKVWNRREQWAQIESMEAFCMTICRNLALDHQKRMENQNVSLEDEDSVSTHPSNVRTPEEQVMQPITDMIHGLVIHNGIISFDGMESRTRRLPP